MGGTKLLKPAERLVVGVESKPNPKRGQNRDWAVGQVINLAHKLKGTEVYIKVESTLVACGYDLIAVIHSCGLKVFADTKLSGMPEKLSAHGVLLNEYKPELVTVMCATGVTGMKALKAELPNTEVLGVPVLTSFKDTDADEVFDRSVDEAVIRFARLADDAAIDGLILAPGEVQMIRKNFGEVMTLNCPGVRSDWMVIRDDDQNYGRVMTPAMAIRAGADRVIVERAVTQSLHPYEVVMRLIEEIASIRP